MTLTNFLTALFALTWHETRDRARQGGIVVGRGLRPAGLAALARISRYEQRAKRA